MLRVVFFRTAAGREPVREWLLGLGKAAKKTIGEDIKTVQFTWPVGLPLVRPLGRGLWELRSSLQDSIARVIVLAEADALVLLHGFIKKSRKTPQADLDLARRRAAEYRKGGERG